jgi:hypothetical protein
MIFVFKTSVKSKRQVKELQLLMDKTLPRSQWNFDLQDRDKILRIDSEENIVVMIIDLLNTHSYHCEELK